MKRNIFKYLRKKILEQSTITETVTQYFFVYKIECLGYEALLNIPTKFPSKKFENVLVDKLIENPEFLKKLEQIENRESNLKTLLD